MIKLSILIPSYNHSRFIVDTLNSHLEDNPFEYEIIIIDDGSVDNSVELIEDWIKEHPKIKTRFLSRENRGVTATLNQLIEMAKGEYVRIFGSDDTSLPRANEKLVKYLDVNEVDAVFGFCHVINQNGDKLAENSIENLGKSVEQYSKDLNRSIIVNWAVVGPSLMLRRDAFTKIGKFNEKSQIEDWYLYLKIISKLRLHFLQMPVANYRHHESNASRTKDKKKRLKNYDSQIFSGEECLSLFTGKERRYLLEAILLLKIKKTLTGRNFFFFFFNGFIYLLIKILNRTV